MLHKGYPSFGKWPMPSLPIHFVKWSRVREARVPDLVDNLGGLLLVLAPRPGHNGLDGSLSNAVLKLLGQGPVAPREKLSRPPTLSAQHGGANLEYVSLAASSWTSRVLP